MTPSAISVVIPTFNRSSYLESALNSVLDQPCETELAVIDGGSTDGTLKLLGHYADALAYWISEPDTGPWNAINKGFAQTTGEIMAWLGSDDMLVPGALAVVREIFDAFPDVEWITSLYPLTWDCRGRVVRCDPGRGFSRVSLLRGEHVPGGRVFAGWVQQESTFWRRSLWERTGAGLNESLKLAADFDLWLRFTMEADLIGVCVPLGGFRAHGQQLSDDFPAYLEEVQNVLAKRGLPPTGRLRGAVQQRLHRAGSRTLRTMRTLGLDEARPAVAFSENAWKLEYR